MTMFTLPPLPRTLVLCAVLTLGLISAESSLAQSWAGDTALGIEVSDKKGKPVEGAEVLLLFVEQEPFEGPASVTTDAKGFAQGLQLADGRWRIDVKRPGFASYTVVVRIQSGKKPAITAGPIRDAIAPPLRVQFLKSPKVAQKPKAKDRDRGRDRGRETAPPPKVEPRPASPPPRPAPVPVTPPTPEPVAPAPKPAPEPKQTQPVEEKPVEEKPVQPPKPAQKPRIEVKTPPPVETPMPDPEAPVEVPNPEGSITTVSPEPAPPVVRPPTPAPPVSLPDEPVEAPNPEGSVATVKPGPTPPVEPPPVAAPPVSSPPVPEPTPPAQAAPEVPVPAPPTAAAPVTPPAAGPASPEGQRREIRSFSDAACPNCKPGTWAMVVEQEVSASTGGRGCPRNLESLALTLNGFADSIGALLVDHEGPILELLDSETKQELRRYLGPDAQCQLVAAPLPEGARFAGYAYEVRDASGGGSCQANQECTLEGSRWAGHPVAYRNGVGTLVYALFENQSRERARIARLIVYFQPPAGGGS